MRVGDYDCMASMSELRISVTIRLGCAFLSLKMLSMTEISVEVVSSPQKADQSLTQRPAAMTSLPLLTVPATIGTCGDGRRQSLSSCSSSAT